MNTANATTRTHRGTPESTTVRHTYYKDHEMNYVGIESHSDFLSSDSCSLLHDTEQNCSGDRILLGSLQNSLRHSL